MTCPDCGTALDVDIGALEEDPGCTGCGKTLELRDELSRLRQVLGEPLEGLDGTLLDNADNEPAARGGVNDPDLDGPCRLAADHIREGKADREIEALLIADGCEPEQAHKIVGGMRGLQSLYSSLSGREQLVRGAKKCIVGAAILGVILFVTGGSGPKALAVAMIFGGVIFLIAGAGRAMKGPRGDPALLVELGVDPTSISSLVMAINVAPRRAEPALPEPNMDPGAASYCPRCGAQYCAGVEVCSECKVALSAFETLA